MQNQSKPSLNPCPKCRGLLVRDEDPDGLRCWNCGVRACLDPDTGELRIPQQEQRGHDDGWYPITPRVQARYREIREIIVRDGLSVAEAMAQFGVSRKTVYRILDLRQRRPD